MTNKMSFFRPAICLAFLAVPVFGVTSAFNTNTVSPTMKVNVNVQSAISLTLGQGSMCSVTAGSGADYSLNFGNVDALGLSSPSCGTKFAPAIPGTTNAAYYTDYTITPVFNSQGVSTNSLTAYVSSTFAKSSLSIVQAASSPAAIGDLSTMSAGSGSPSTVATNTVSGTAVTRYVGVSIASTNGSNLSGADSATITYTLTVQ